MGAAFRLSTCFCTTGWRRGQLKEEAHRPRAEPGTARSAHSLRSHIPSTRAWQPGAALGGHEEKNSGNTRLEHAGLGPNLEPQHLLGPYPPCAPSPFRSRTAILGHGILRPQRGKLGKHRARARRLGAELGTTASARALCPLVLPHPSACARPSWGAAFRDRKGENSGSTGLEHAGLGPNLAPRRLLGPCAPLCSLTLPLAHGHPRRGISRPQRGKLRKYGLEHAGLGPKLEPRCLLGPCAPLCSCTPSTWVWKSWALGSEAPQEGWLFTQP